MSTAPAPSADASHVLVAALFAVDPIGLGGVVLRCAAGDARDAWLATLTSLLPVDQRQRRVPLHVNDDRLLGGLDLAATLRVGAPVAMRGLLAEADGGVVVLAMAERVTASTAAALAAVMDAGEVVVERQGIGTRHPSRLGVVALDEGIGDDEQVPARLRDRLAFHVVLEPRPRQAPGGDDAPLVTRVDIAAARARLAGIGLTDELVESLCAASLALGVDSPRATLFACRAARAMAALDGRVDVSAEDASVAAALVLAPRATQVPAAPPADDGAETDAPETEAPEPDATEAEPPPDSAPPEPPADADADASADESTEPGEGSAVDDVVLEAALAAIPPGLLASIALGRAKERRNSSAGRVGAAKMAQQRGRPMGVRRAALQGGARLNLIETLRTAAPWQALRREEAARAGQANADRIHVRQDDFRLWRFKQRSETTTIFVVDASGSAALHRLAETKGAVELLLADCYVRRDSVAVIAFRGAGAELLLPPTRSLVRAKRGLAGLPGGGGTPLAAGIAAASTLADAVRRKGAMPVVVLLTDGRANIARDGKPGRIQANEDSHAAARQLRLLDVASLLLDTSPQAQEPARLLAVSMGARYLPLPYAGAAAMSEAVRTAGRMSASADARLAEPTRSR